LDLIDGDGNGEDESESVIDTSSTVQTKNWGSRKKSS